MHARAVSTTLKKHELKDVLENTKEISKTKNGNDLSKSFLHMLLRHTDHNFAISAIDMQYVKIRGPYNKQTC
jgi:hypothetical protein